MDSQQRWRMNGGGLLKYRAEFTTHISRWGSGIPGLLYFDRLLNLYLI
jgi:hypothetical protein